MAMGLGVLVLAANGACGLLLGIEDLPERLPDAGVDASSGCTNNESSGCAAQCSRHDFCDDFDRDGQAPSSAWLGALGFSSPLRKGTADLKVVGASRSPPASLEAIATSDASRSSYELLIHEFPLREVRPDAGFHGVRFAFDFVLDDLTLRSPQGPAGDAGSVLVAGLLAPSGTLAPGGVAIALSPEGVHIVAAQDVLDDKGTPPVATIREMRLKDLVGNWVRFELFVASRAEAIAAGFSSCAPLPEGAVAAGAMASRAAQACIALPGILADASAWASNPVLSVGAVVFEDGNLAARFDNVTADFSR